MTDGWEKWHEKFSRQSARATDAIMELARIKVGMRVLDLASGSGEPALSIAARVGSEGRVIATDIVPGMIEIAKKNACDKGLSNIDFKVANAEALPFPNESFDAVTCRFGVMFFSDPQKAMVQVHRVLKKDGFVSLVAWGPEHRNPRFSTTTSILKKYQSTEKSNDISSSPSCAISPTHFDAGDSLFKFSERGSLSAILNGSRFREIIEEYREIPWVWDGPVEEQFRSFAETSAPFRKMFETLGTNTKQAATKEILSVMERYFDGRRVNFTAVINCVSGRK